MADNNDRAFWAQCAVDHMAGLTCALGGETQKTLIGDLLANLRHLCDAYGLDFDQINEASAQMHHEEVVEDRAADRRVDPLA